MVLSRDHFVSLKLKLSSNNIGSAIRMFRVRMRLTQGELCDAMRIVGDPIDQSALSRIERGEVGIVDRRLASIAAAMDTTVQEIRSLANEIAKLDRGGSKAADTDNGALAQFSELMEEDYRRISAAINGSSEMLWHFCLRDKRLWASADTTSIYGGEDPSGLVTGWRDLLKRFRIHTDDLRIVYDTISSAMLSNSGERFDFRCRVRHSEGHLIAVRVRGKVSNSRFDERPEIAGTISEISDNDFFASQAVDRLDDCYIFAKDRQLRFTYVNQALANALGMAKKDLIGRTDREIHPREDEWRFFIEQDQKVMQHEATGKCGEVIRSSRIAIAEEILTTVDGATHYLSTIKEKVVMPNGETQMLGIATDMTQFTQFTRCLKQMLAATDDVYFAMNDRRQYTFGNAAMVQFAGCTSEERLVGQRSTDLFSGEIGSRLSTAEVEVLEGAARVSIVVRETRSDLDTRWRLLDLFPVKDDFGKTIGIVGKATGITGLDIARIHILKPNEKVMKGLNSLSGLAWIQDDNLSIVQANERLEKQFPNLVRGDSIGRLWDAETVSEIKKRMDGLHRGTNDFTWKMDLTFPNGKLLQGWCLHMFPLCDSRSNPIGILCIARSVASETCALSDRMVTALISLERTFLEQEIQMKGVPKPLHAGNNL